MIPLGAVSHRFHSDVTSSPPICHRNKWKPHCSPKSGINAGFSNMSHNYTGNLLFSLLFSSIIKFNYGLGRKPNWLTSFLQLLNMICTMLSNLFNEDFLKWICFLSIFTSYQVFLMKKGWFYSRSNQLEKGPRNYWKLYSRVLISSQT